MPVGLVAVDWNFEMEEFESFQIDVRIYNDIGDVSKPGIYFQMYNGRIGDTVFYFGFQTDVSDPNAGRGRGKGIVFSRWETRDLSKVRSALRYPDGWVVSAESEGDFVSLRRKYEWTDHKYSFELTPVDEDEEGVWYGLSVVDYDVGRKDSIGSIHFPNPERDRKPLVKNGAGTWLELYGGSEYYQRTPFWHVSIERCLAKNLGETIKAKQATPCYLSRAYPASVYFDDSTKSFHLLAGRQIDLKPCGEGQPISLL